MAIEFFAFEMILQNLQQQKITLQKYPSVQYAL